MAQTEQVYREREKRYIDAVELRIPDRVPVYIPFSFFPAKFAGVTARDSYYDFGKWKSAYLKTALYFEPDRCGYTFNQSGRVLEALDYKPMAWPGHGVSIHHSHQYIEMENMKEDEYDMFLHDFSGFMLGRFLPRTHGLLSPLAQLPSSDTLLRSLPFDQLATAEFVSLFENIARIAREAVQWQTEVATLTEELKGLGFPARTGFSPGLVAFDNVSDNLRGMRGAMLDMYRRPDKLVEACELLLSFQIERIKSAPRPSEFAPSFIPLHRGANGFMSLKQFERFYWPYLKKLVIALVEAGHTPDIFFEGDYTSRLEYLRELPRGKVIARFDRTDMARAREILGNHICISGNVPSSLLQTGSIEDVKKYCRWLIDVVGKDGGFIMSPGSSLDEVKPENLKTMIDYTKEYGKY